MRRNGGRSGAVQAPPARAQRCPCRRRRSGTSVAGDVAPPQVIHNFWLFRPTTPSCQGSRDGGVGFTRIA
jgi:hypothetical protein